MCFIPFYKTCNPSQYIAVSGLGINGLKFVKKKWILPGQQYIIIDVSPEIYEVYNSFSLAFFTIGPKLEHDKLALYTQLIVNCKDANKIIKGIIDEEIRNCATKQIFNKSEIYDKVQLELDQFGLKIYTINLKQESNYQYQTELDTYLLEKHYEYNNFFYN